MAGSGGTNGGGWSGGTTGGGWSGSGGAASNTAAAGGAGTGGVRHAQVPVTDEPPVAVCDPESTPDLDGPAATITNDRPDFGVAIDVNHDGKLDLVMVGQQATVAVYIGNGDGSFANARFYDTDLQPAQVSPVGALSVGDVDADGNPDLVVAARTSTELSVLFSKGDGSFSEARRFSTSKRILRTELSDVDEDATLDLLIGTLDNLGVAVSVLHGNGDGTFGDPQELWRGSLFDAFRVADLNADGHRDLVVYDGNLTVRLGCGGGEFDASQAYSIGGGGSSDIEIDDFNRDGRLDLVVLAGCGRSTPSGILELLGNRPARWRARDSRRTWHRQRGRQARARPLRRCDGEDDRVQGLARRPRTPRTAHQSLDALRD